MVTDTRRKRRSDPGEPERLPGLHPAQGLRGTSGHGRRLAAACRTATVGCLECKKVVIDSLIELLTPYWEKRRALEADPGRVWEILEAGNAKARADRPEDHGGRPVRHRILAGPPRPETP